MTTTKWTAASGFAATAALALAAVVAPAAHAASTNYVALGDSYSAGVGTKSKVNDCYQSTLGYAPLIAQAKSLVLNYQACSGATTADVTSKQLGALSAGTSLVSMTIGGNDVGFANVLTTCAQPSWMSDCNGAIAGGRAILTGQLPGRYDSLYSAIRTKAPNAKVVIAGYPRIFNGEDCNALTFFSPQEQASLNAATDDLDNLIKTKAAARGFTFADVRSQFVGHAVCGAEWINGLSNPVEESYHPNRLGNQAYASILSPLLTGSTMPMPAIAARSAAADAVPTIDLTSAVSIAGAKKAGLNVAELRSLNADLHSGNAARVDKAVKRLRVLDQVAAQRLHRD